jgi:uncharacterized surface protein with fasciclin (FAS1) repeats
MNFRLNISALLLAVTVLGTISACQDNWDEHTELKDGTLGTDLLKRIEGEPELSRFAELLNQSAYKDSLSSSRKYTIWAPSNTALAALGADALDSKQELNQFIAFHIAELSYNNDRNDTLRLKTIGGKFARFSRNAFEGAGIVSANQYAGNGVLHIIDKAEIPKSNIIETLYQSAFEQKDYLTALNYEVIDSSLAEQTGVDPTTGKPVYKPGTGIVTKNYLFDRIGDLRKEDQEYTMILLTNDVIEQQAIAIADYVEGKTDEQSSINTALVVLKDLVFKGKYSIDKLPGELISLGGVRVPINKGAIQASYETSNGMVYVMNQLNIPLANKVLPITQQGEAPTGFSRNDKSANIAYRLRRNPGTGALFNDIYVFNHKIPLFHVKYGLKDLFKIKYKVYWVAPNDVQTVTFKQRFAFADPNSTALPETQVDLKNFGEVYVGEITPANYGDFNAYVVAANNGGDGINSINIDYFRLEPQLP